MIVRILLGIAGILVLLLITAVFMRKEYSVHREIVINVPTEKVFNYIKQLKNQDYYNKWVMVDPAKKSEFKGNDGTVGFIYGWNGNKDVGEGEEEIKSMRLKFYKRSTEKFVSRIDPEAFSASGSRLIFPVACHLRVKALATKRGEEFQFEKNS